jgi:hypothetical protein
MYPCFSESNGCLELGLRIQVDGGFFLVYGTSAASPVVGSILTMVNDARLHAGKSPIGFINPAVRLFHFSMLVNDGSVISYVDLLAQFREFFQ